MSKKIKFISIIIFALIMLMILSTESNAGYQKLHSLQYNVVLNKDGSADITEKWDVTASETNTLFKEFKVYSSETGKYTLTNPVVRDISTGKTYRKINQLQYHVDPGCYYGIQKDVHTYEIAWNIGADNTTKRKTYEISYTVLDAIQNGVDCSQFYWQFIAKENGMPAENISATIRLPIPMETETECKMYAHGPLYGTIHQTNENTVVAKIPELNPNTMFEVRIVMPKGIFTNSKSDSYLTLKGIVEEETVWADKANEKREKASKEEKLFKIVNVCVFIFDVFLLYCLINTMKKYVKTKKEYQIGTIEYFRDIPYDDATPGECIYMRKGVLSYNESSKLIMATVLNFCLKGILELEDRDKKTFIIIKNINMLPVGLKNEEREILKILLDVASRKNTNEITFDDISNYIETRYVTEVPRLQRLNSIVKAEEIERGNINAKRFSNIGFESIFIVLSFIIISALLPVFSSISEIIVPILIAIIILFIICFVKASIKSIERYTIQGSIEREQWKGLEKFMKDYSKLDERGAMDIVLWEHYLVFASALGIADKLLKQLKIVYPNFEEEYGRNSKIIYIVDSRGYERSMNTLTRATSNSHERLYPSESSSGSGGGGGFSSGGGGRRRWRKHGGKIKKSTH